MWKNKNILTKKDEQFFVDFQNYLNTEVSGQPKGMIRP
jgi:hypothetical protein